MKKFTFLILLVSILAVCTSTSYSQMPNGSVAPAWTMTDLDGTSHTMYDYLDQGKPVYIDFSATWCGPCWTYHTSGHLENLYDTYGPDGSDEVMVFMIEGDASTNTDCLYGPTGCNSTTQGNWVTGTPYPIIDNSSMTSPYMIGYWPTIYMVCPDRLIYENSQITTAQHYALGQACPAPGTNALDVKLLTLNSPEGTYCDGNVAPQVRLQNYGSDALTSLDIVSKIDGVVQSTTPWTGSLSQYGVALVDIPVIPNVPDGAHTFTIELTNPNGGTDEDLANNNFTSDFTILSYGRVITVDILTDDYGSETSWELEDQASSTIVASGGGYESNTQYSKDICVEPGGCFTFTIYDAYGDGICCSYGNGNYTISFNGSQVTTGGSFTSSEVVADIGNCWPTSVESTNLSEVNIYPNPTTGLLNIENADNASINVYNVLGEVVSSIDNADSFSTLDLSALPSGNYMVRVLTQNQVISKNIVLNK